MKLNSKGFAPVAVIIAVVVAVAVGVGVYVYTANKDDSSDDSSSSSTSQSASSVDDALFEQLQPPYVMTVVSKDSANPATDSTGTIKFESETRWSITSDTNGQAAMIVYDGDYVYSSQDGVSWVRFASSASDSTEELESYGPSDEEIANYRDNSVKVGEEACGSGTCDVFEVTEESGEVATLYVDQDTKRVHKIVVTQGTLTTEVTFDYEADATVTVPTDYQELNIPTL